MVDLLVAIRNALHADTDLDYIRNSDIFFSPVVNYCPKIVRGYAVGIVPGADDRKGIGGDLFETRTSVRVVLWIQTHKPETVVTGDSTNAGTEQFAADVDSVLDENRLGLAEVLYAVCRRIEEPRVFGDQKKPGPWMIQRVLTYEYEREVLRHA